MRCRYATGAGGNLRREAANAHGLRNLLAYGDLFGAIAIGRGGERHANGIADPFLQHDRVAAAALLTMPLAPIPASVILR